MTEQTEDQATNRAEKLDTVAKTDVTQPLEYPFEDGDFLRLGPEIFTLVGDHSVISWKGVNYIPQPEATEHKSLKDYHSGDLVETIKDGLWIEGMVNGTEKRLGLVYVHTNRGPVTVARPDGIRPRVK